jgi:uncharacterized membrane protein
MFWIIPIVAFIVIAALGFWRGNVLDKNNRDGDGWCGFGIFMTILAALALVVSVFHTLVTYSAQKYDNEDLIRIQQQTDIYQKRADVLTKQFAHYLADVYPQHEKGIFDKIKPGEVDIYLVKYPELKSSETITQLIKEIRSLQDDYYSQQLERAQILRNMRYRTKSPWVFQFAMPKDISIPAS